ncbi:MAG: proline--tRNA ligase [Clostridia bacterium]|nr:proline--tRNA ligase [Clostridia bacterium]
MKNKAITSRDEDFAKWYTYVVRAARLADYSNVKGCIVFEPNGYAIWEKMQSILDKKFKQLGHQNVYMPVLIPESLLKKEGELIEGFAPEGAWVTQGGNKTLEERMMIRPTSETLFSDYYASKVSSYRDLPLLYNQWANVMRWEKETRPFLRTREFLWQEGHTIHETAAEAEAETLQMLNVYKDFFENVLAIPVITGKKTEKEKFAGAEYTCTVEALMYNGVSLQSATSHYFGQKFSKAYGIQFLNRENKLENVYQTSWGCTTRMIGGLIMVHSDDNGLVLPPRIAPRQVAIVPIGTDETVMTLADEYNKKLLDADITSFVDKTERSPGFKFAEHEVNGIPVRIEIGMRDLAENMITLARRDTREKIRISKDCDIVAEVQKLMDEIQNNLFNCAKKRAEEKTYTAFNMAEVEKIMNTQPGFVKAMWCGDEACELKMKEIRGTKSRCILENEAPIADKCVCCGKEAKHLVVWGIQY